ncbi:two component system DNA-binding response regulator [Escherichia coli]|uniref:Two component system DNA-binding response regulator n=1 Tax=Escherichia coli TaxID=562 RepID=A0A376U4Y1_ECOLX|nr:two component system DNA-binding response regulator [Escherichia coli]
MKRLMTASWPGNVRQLVNVIEQCVALTSSPVISDALVEQALEGENTALPTFVEARNQFELNYLRKLLQNYQRQRHPRRREWRGATGQNFINCFPDTSWMQTISRNELALCVTFSRSKDRRPFQGIA